MLLICTFAKDNCLNANIHTKDIQHSWDKIIRCSHKDSSKGLMNVVVSRGRSHCFMWVFKNDCLTVVVLILRVRDCVI